MRGPSSSHTAASVRIGRIMRQLLGEKPVRALFEFDPHGSLATTYESQGSAIGLAAGLLGWEITHPDLQNSLSRAKKVGIDIDFQIKAFTATHPNTYKITVEGVNGRKLNLRAISSGGGMIEINSIDGIKLSLKGDFFESLFLFNTIRKGDKEKLKNDLKTHFPNAIILFFENDRNTLLNLKTGESVYTRLQEWVPKHLKIELSCEIDPVMPIISQKSYKLPFSTYEEMLLYTRNKNSSLADLSLEYESVRAGISKAEVFEKMKELVLITQQGIKEGLSGTQYKDRILGQQSHLILKAENENKLIQSSINNRIIAYTSALMEVKSSMGVIVAAPTAGSCAVLGGAVFGASDKLDGNLENITRAFLAAGLIGVFIARDYTFAAEEGGCQVECGAASGMAAAGLVEMMGRDFRASLLAASTGLRPGGRQG